MNAARLPDLEQVRFFVDEDLAGVGLGLMRLRHDVVVGSHKPVKDLVPSLDAEWIPVVAHQGWIAITNDRHIRTRHYEATAALECGLRCVHLRPAVRDAARWDFVRLLAMHWDAVEALCAEDGPVWLELTPRRTRRREFQPGKPPRLPPAAREQRKD